MLYNYLTIAARTLRKHLGPTLINVIGLTAGIAACLLIGLWVERELRFDDFHPEAERIHRVALEARVTDTMTRTPGVPAPLAPALRQTVPQVAAVTQFRPTRVIFQQQAQTLSERVTLSADSSFFDVFGGFELLHGARTAALNAPDAVVLSATTARALFGRTDVVGETLTMDEAPRRVTAVMADVPEASHLQFDAVAARPGIPPIFKENWTGYAYLTYAKLAEGTSPAVLQDGLDRIVETQAMVDVRGRFGEPSDAFVYRLFPEALSRIHLYSDFTVLGPGGSIGTVYTFVLIGLFILGIACINFMNLATARATERATEVGMRKALGAGRRQLVGQFLGEAVLLTAIATGSAFALAATAIPVFNSLAGTSMQASVLLQPVVLGAGGALALAVGLIAGSYPALVLTRFTPATVLKASGSKTTSGQGRRLRQGLVVAQFAISIALIIGTLVAREQFEYIQTKQLGIDRARVVEIERASDLGEQQAAFARRVRAMPGVTSASAGDGIFGGVSQTSFVAYGEGDSNAQALRYLQTDLRFAETMDINVIAGRGFDPARPADSSAVLLNQAAVDQFGWEEPIGQRLASCDSGCTYTVIGMVEDFHFESLREQVEPLAIVPTHPLGGSDRPESIYARLAPGQTRPVLDQVQSAWGEVAGSGTPFQYSFLDQTYDQIHRDVKQAGDLFSLFSALAVLVACLGLFGLATYTVQRRTKEIGIRKALGATEGQVARLLSREFVQLVGIAFVVAVPLAYLGMQQWLQDFAYRTHLGVSVFLVAGGIAMAIAVLTISTQAFRAARLDPATTLKDE